MSMSERETAKPRCPTCRGAKVTSQDWRGASVTNAAGSDKRVMSK